MTKSIAEVWRYDSLDSPIHVVNGAGDVDGPDDHDIDTSPQTSSSEPTVEDLPHEYPEPREVAPLEHPQSLEANKERIARVDMARAAITDRQLTAYEEYGGGIDQTDEYEERDLPRYRPLDAVIRGSEAWQTEIYDAVERFGMNELTLETYKAMGGTQRLHFVLHFANFRNAITRHAKLIKLEDKSMEHETLLARRYGNDRTQSELFNYSSRLEALEQALDETGIPAAVSKDLTPRREKISKNAHYWEYQIAFKISSDGTRHPQSVK